MKWLDRLTEPLVRSRVNEALEMQSGPAQMIEAQESTGDEDYAFKLLNGGTASSKDLPADFVMKVLRDSHWNYETHGLARFIVERFRSIIYENGIQYALDFPDGFPSQLRENIERRVERFWYNEDNDIQDRASEFVLEALLSGEHGWRLDTLGNGDVRIADITRDDIAGLEVDRRDKRKLLKVHIGDALDEVETLNTIQIEHRRSEAGLGHLQGNCVYFRIGARSSKFRGTPLLQDIIDELKSEKQFRIISTDRVLARMAMFLMVRIKGYNMKQLQEYAKSAKTQMPKNGKRYYVNDQMDLEFKSATLESSDIATLIKLFQGVPAGFKAFPSSWIGYADGTNRATAESQQEPAERDAKRLKGQFLNVFKRVIEYQIDSAICSGALRYEGSKRIAIVNKNGTVQQGNIRDFVDVTISNIPLDKERPSDQPLAATDRAMTIISKDELRAQSSGRKAFSADKEREIINYALSKDGTGIELSDDEIVEYLSGERDEDSAYNPESAERDQQLGDD